MYTYTAHKLFDSDCVHLLMLTCVCYSTATTKVYTKQHIAELVYTERQVALVQGILQVHSSKKGWR